MVATLTLVGILFLKGVVLPVLGLLAIWAGAKVPAWIQAHVNNTSVAGVLSRLATLAFMVVQEVDQTFVSNLTDPTPAQLQEALTKALDKLKTYLGDAGLKELEKVLGLDGSTAIEKMLITAIESAVHTLKSSASIVEKDAP